MAKTREKIQQLGFWDAEVSKPDHDAVCLWAYENADTIFRTVCPEEFIGPSWRQNDVDHGHSRDGRVKESVIEMARAFTEANPRPDPRVGKKTLEYVLRTYTGYQEKTERIVGYADLLIQTERPCVIPQYKPSEKSYEDDEVVGFEIGWTSRFSPSLLVEAKSVLPTVGELMRQLQLYRTAFRGAIVVVSPDDKYAQILSEQDVSFVKYAC